MKNDWAGLIADALQHVSKLPIGCGPRGPKLTTLIRQPARCVSERSRIFSLQESLEKNILFKNCILSVDDFVYSPKFYSFVCAVLIILKEIRVIMISGDYCRIDFRIQL